jgi:hypothetical protein
MAESVDSGIRIGPDFITGQLFPKPTVSRNLKCNPEAIVAQF